jgi:hypothetical protein
MASRSVLGGRCSCAFALGLRRLFAGLEEHNRASKTTMTKLVQTAVAATTPVARRVIQVSLQRAP